MATSSPNRPSGPRSLLWLGGGAAAVWLPLLLADNQPWQSSTAPISDFLVEPPSTPVKPLPTPTIASLPKPVVTKLAQAPAALRSRPSPWLKNLRPPVASLRLPSPPQRVEPTTAKALVTPFLAKASPRQQALPGSILLGGPLSLESLQEKPMVPAARIEQALRARSDDRLSAVPDHLRSTMETMIEGEKQVLPAEVVHLPAPHLQKPEEYPMAVQANGVAETPVTPSELSRQALERWAQRQSPTPRGTVRPVTVVLQPLAAESRANER
jgi:hypothetical protein